MKARPPRGTPRDRRASVLLVVLVVVMLLTLGVYAFTERMLAEREAVARYGESLQASAAAGSGVEMTASFLDAAASATGRDDLDATALFRGVVVREHGGDVARFTVVSPPAGGEGGCRYGPSDESAKLNLDALLRQSEMEGTYFADGLEYEDRNPDAELRDRLLGLPGMTPETADAVLDWIDEDDERRAFGAERADYAGLPWRPRNGPIETLDELLLVRGVTPELFHGEDANRNGLSDPGEDDGAASPPADDADGVLDFGWSEYLTVLSREVPVRADGRRKVHLNGEDLAALYDALEAEFDPDVARFVTAFRLVGPLQEDDKSSGDGEGGPGSGGGSPGAGKGGDEGTTRGGLSLVSGGQYVIFSIYELIDSRVRVDVDGRSTVLDSPWTSDELESLVPELSDAMSIDAAPLPGRVNVNQARAEVLRAVPGVSGSLADAVAAARDVAGTGRARASTAWLVSERLVSLEEMRRLDRYLTGGGGVHTAQVVGFFDKAGAFSRVRAVIDATRRPCRVVSFSDLSELGRGYGKERLLPAETAASAP